MSGRELLSLARRLELEQHLLRLLHGYVPAADEMARPGVLWASLRGAADEVQIELTEPLRTFLRVWCELQRLSIAEGQRCPDRRYLASGKRRLIRET